MFEAGVSASVPVSRGSGLLSSSSSIPASNEVQSSKTCCACRGFATTFSGPRPTMARFTRMSSWSPVGSSPSRARLNESRISTLSVAIVNVISCPEIRRGQNGSVAQMQRVRRLIKQIMCSTFVLEYHHSSHSSFTWIPHLNSTYVGLAVGLAVNQEYTHRRALCRGLTRIKPIMTNTEISLKSVLISDSSDSFDSFV